MLLLHIHVILAMTKGRFRGKADAVSSPFSTSALLLQDGSSIHDSTEILEYVSQRYGTPETSLYSEPDAATMERHFHDGLGVYSRCLGYFYVLCQQEGLARLAKDNVGLIQDALFRFLSSLSTHLA